MHTPEQAELLWCPMARVARHEVVRTETDQVGNLIAVKEAHHIVAGCNRDALGMRLPNTPASCRCIADKCAMWRWEYTTASVPTITEGANGAKARTYEQKTVRTHGYCGLAPLYAN